MSSLHEPRRLRRVVRQPETVVRISPVVVERAAPQVDASEPEGPSMEAIVAEVRRAAFEEGKAAGAAEAMTSVEAMRAAGIESLAKQLLAAADELHARREAVVDEVVRDVSELAVELAHVLVARAFEDADLLPERIARALELAPAGTELVLRVHPDCGLSDAEIAALAKEPAVQVVRDASVDPSGCVLVANACTIDAQIPAALERVRRELEDVGLAPARTPGAVHP